MGYAPLDDLRQLMNGQGKRHALVMNKQADNTYTTYLFDRDNTPMITNQNIYFLPMKRSEMSNNPNLEQTKGLGKPGRSTRKLDSDPSYI